MYNKQYYLFNSMKKNYIYSKKKKKIKFAIKIV